MSYFGISENSLERDWKFGKISVSIMTSLLYLSELFS